MASERKKRTKLGGTDNDQDSYPTIIVETEDEANPSGNQHEISVLDINDSGMGITCLSRLKVGQYIFFNDNQPGWNLPQKGVVMWTFKAVDGLRAGIKFL